MTSGHETSIWRVVFPHDRDDAQDVLPLYIDGATGDVITEGRRRLRVSSGARVSLGSYFNAFPAAYWRAHTDLTAVTVRIEIRGRGRVLLRASDGSAVERGLAERDVDGHSTVSVDLSLDSFQGGGAAWIDLVAAPDAPLTLLEAEWTAAGVGAATTSVAMATFNRPRDCVRHLLSLAESELRDVVGRVFVVDQGDQSVRAEGRFLEAQTLLDGRLTVLQQRNLGGSGGFSRGMLESLRDGRDDFVLLLDDDAVSEPEAIFRAVRFATAARNGVIVSGGMLHLDRPAVLYTQSEQWDHRIGWVRLRRPGAYDHDFTDTRFRDTPYLHTLQTSDFGGWWMCLVPTHVLRDAGLAMPLFLKGDDVEFGLRARSRGVPTVSVPGVALWHMGWDGKAPTRTWESYFLHRNRLITELLHSRSRRGTGVLLHSFLGDVKLVLCLEYFPVHMRAQAMLDAVDPDRLFPWLPERAATMRQAWQRYRDANATTTDAPQGEAPPAPRGPFGNLALVPTLVRHLLVPSRRTPPAIHVEPGALGWWVFRHTDSAVVDAPDGSGRTVLRRSRRRTQQALGESAKRHFALWIAWPRLSRRWRAAAPSLTAIDRWAAETET